jgi:DNA-binding GntR family transcriptional regulator
VFDEILSAVHDGRLQPGQRVNDSQLAEQLGVSRTPVREALQRLREIGIIEASASRFTRVAVVSPEATGHAMLVWLALYGALVDEVVDAVPDETIAAMKADHDEFLTQLTTLDTQRIARANAEFFEHLVELSHNDALLRAISSVVHVVRLGSAHLPDFVDLRALGEAQAILIAAANDQPELDAA